MASKRLSRVFMEDEDHDDDARASTPYRGQMSGGVDEAVQTETNSKHHIRPVFPKRDSNLVQPPPNAATADFQGFADGGRFIDLSKLTWYPELEKSRGNSPQTPLSMSSQSSFDEFEEYTTGRPVNFGMVGPGIYRSGYPKPEDYEFIKNLGLKTIVTLVRKEEHDSTYLSFIAGSRIKHHVFDMKGTKKEDIPIKTMRSILRLLMNQQNHPLLIHCNHGKHRTGCVVAIFRKVSGWGLPNIVKEYTSFAEPKVRDCDVKYITAFELSGLSNPFISEAAVRMQLRNLVRTLLFSLCVVVIWLISGSKLKTQNGSAEPRTGIWSNTGDMD